MTHSKDGSEPWQKLSFDYELGRARKDSLDTLVEWPAQRDILGDVTGKSILDLGCGSGAKLTELVGDGAISSVGIDISSNFVNHHYTDLQLIQADLSELGVLPELVSRKFDRIMFLQSFGYARDPVGTLKTARAMLSENGFILLTRTQPIRYAMERAERNGTSLGEEYFSSELFSYNAPWNDDIRLTKRPYTMSDLINTFGAAGLWIEMAVEPQMPEEARSDYPHKAAWMDKYLGILLFKLRALPER